MSYKRNIRYLRIIIFFHNLIFAYVIERLFAMERGMTVQLVVYTEIIYAVTCGALEVPSGVLADRFGRKRLLVAAALLMCGEFFILIFARGFWFFGLSAFTAGLSGAAHSGTWNALLYDSLKVDGFQAQFEKHLGRLQVTDFTAALIAGLSGSILAKYCGYAFNYVLSTVSSAIAVVFTLKLVEPPVSVKPIKKANTRSIVTEALAFFKSHPTALTVAGHAALVAACVCYVDEFWQVYLNSITFPLALFGVASAALSASRAPGALLTAKLLGRFNHQTLIAAASVTAVLGIGFAAYIKNPWGILGIAVLCFAAGIIEPAADGFIHHQAGSSARATIESITSMAQRLCSIAVGLVFGVISTRFTIFSGYWFIAAVIGIAAVIFAASSATSKKRGNRLPPSPPA